MYFLRGSLPWQNLPGKNKDEKYKNIKKKKLETSLEVLCKGYPSEFKEFMEYCRSLKFEEDPDYKLCIGMFEKCMKRHNLDPKVNDFTWKQNRLSKDKEALKNSMLDVIRKKPKEAKPQGPSSVNGARDSVERAPNMQATTGADAMQGYGATGGILGMQ